MKPLSSPAAIMNLHHSLQKEDPLAIVLTALENCGKDLEELSYELHRTSRGVININLYYSTGGTPGLGLHADASFILVRQLRGHKTWRFPFHEKSKPLVKMALPSTDAHLPVTLNPGDWLFIPDHVPHLVMNDFATISEHLTFSIHFPRAEDVIASIVRTLLTDEEPGLFVSEKQQLELLKRFKERLNHTDLVTHAQRFSTQELLNAERVSLARFKKT